MVSGHSVDRILIVFLAIFFAILLVIAGGVFAEPIARRIRRRVPNFTYEGELFVMWGALVFAAFALGMVVMYLLR